MKFEKVESGFQDLWKSPNGTYKYFRGYSNLESLPKSTGYSSARVKEFSATTEDEVVEDFKSHPETWKCASKVWSDAFREYRWVFKT